MKASHGILLPAVCRIFCLHFLLLGSVDALTAQQQRENSPASGPNTWNLKNIDNRMKNQQEVEGYLVQHPTPGSPEQLQVRASCDNSGMHWLIAYLSGTRPAVGLQQNIPPGTVSSPRLWVPEGAGMGMATSLIAGQAVGGLMAGVANAMRPTGPWVHLQLKVDDKAPVEVMSVNGYSNVAGIRFDLPVSATARSQDDVNMAHAMSYLTPGQNRAPATIVDVQQAHTVLVSLPREDGSVMYLEVHPQDANFQKFTDACLVALAGQMNPMVREHYLPAGGGGGIHDSRFKDPNLPLLHPEEFQGDLAEFNAMLPTLMERAALHWKMPVHSLDAETALISKDAAQCSSLTPDAVDALSPMDRSQLERGHNFPKWQACEGGYVPVTKLVRQYDPNAERGVLYQITPVGGWEHAQFVEMHVMMSGLPNDGVEGHLFSYYGIVDAKIRVAPLQGGSSAVTPASTPVSASSRPAVSAPASSAPAASPAAGSGEVSGHTTAMPAPAGGNATPDAHTAKLTRTAPSIDGHAQITAPGRGAHAYNVFYVDTRDFTQGGELDVMIQLDTSSRTSGSFDLFRGDTRFSQAGASSPSLVGKYDVRPGAVVHLNYRFSAGQVFAFGAEGNWFSPKGQTGNILFRASVH